MDLYDSQKQRDVVKLYIANIDSYVLQDFHNEITTQWIALI